MAAAARRGHARVVLGVSWEDLADDVQSAVCAELGVEVVYRPTAGTPVTIRGVFSNELSLIALGEGSDVQTTRPKIFVRQVDLGVAPARGDEFDVGGATYVVGEVRRDGEGGVELLGEVTA